MEARNRPLPEWFNRTERGQLRLPRFQRFEAWGHNEIASLLENVLQGLPVGATLILEIGGEEPFISRTMVGVPAPVDRPTEHLLDGQQRLTALWRSFNDTYDNRTYFVTFEADEEHGNVVVPRINGVPRYRRNGQRYPLWADNPVEIHAKGCIPLKLLRPGDIGREITSWCDAAAAQDLQKSREIVLQIMELRQRVAAFNIPFLSLPVGTPKDVALNVFIKMNTSSVKLTPFDIIVAQVEAETGESLHNLVAQANTAVPAVAGYLDPEDLILDVACLRENRTASQANYQTLDLPRLVQDWNQLTAGIAWAVQILEEEKVFDAARLPTTNVISVIAALHPVVPADLDAHGNARTVIRKYIWRAFLTSRYGNSAASRAFQDFKALRQLLQHEAGEDQVPIFNENDYPLPALDELKRASWPKQKDILARGILAVSIRVGAEDLADGTPANRQNLIRREYHHLFPDSLLTGDAGLSSSHSYKALNCALVSWRTNRNIAAKEPILYLRERVEGAALGEAEIRHRLTSHLIPYDQLAVAGYEAIPDPAVKAERIKADYERFLDQRARMILDAARVLCAGQPWRGMAQ